jgi:hypothetical protein
VIVPSVTVGRDKKQSHPAVRHDKLVNLPKIDGTTTSMDDRRNHQQNPTNIRNEQNVK